MLVPRLILPCLLEITLMTLSGGVYVRLTPFKRHRLQSTPLPLEIKQLFREFWTEIKDSSVSMWKAKCVAEMKCLLKESGSKKKDVEVRSLP